MTKQLAFSVTKKDLNIHYFSGTGKGGQHRNKHQNCVRMHHTDSGVRITGQSHRERRANLRQALNSLASHPKFKLWVNRKINGLEELKKTVGDMMKPENLKIEVRENGRWLNDNATP